MRLAAVYLAALAGALGSWATVQFGWRPAFAAVWDQATYLGLAGICLFGSWFAAAGLVALSPWRRLPRVLGGAVRASVIWVTSALFIATTTFSAQSTSEEILPALGVGLGVGVVLSLLQGLMARAEPGEPRPAPDPRGFLALLVLCVAAGAALLLVPREQVDPELATYAGIESVADAVTRAMEE